VGHTGTGDCSSARADETASTHRTTRELPSTLHRIGAYPISPGPPGETFVTAFLQPESQTAKAKSGTQSRRPTSIEGTRLSPGPKTWHHAAHA
jgi:hypothetical protein